MKILFLALAFFSASILAKPVNINTADAQTIADSLTGIGLKKAEAIVQDRLKNGPFKNADELKRVFGIGDKIVSANRNDILLTVAKPPVPNADKSSAAPAPAAQPVAPAPAATPAPATPPAKK